MSSTKFNAITFSISHGLNLNSRDDKKIEINRPTHQSDRKRWTGMEQHFQSENFNQFDQTNLQLDRSGYKFNPFSIDGSVRPNLLF